MYPHTLGRGDPTQAVTLPPCRRNRIHPLKFHFQTRSLNFIDQHLLWQDYVYRLSLLWNYRFVSCPSSTSQPSRTRMELAWGIRGVWVCTMQEQRRRRGGGGKDVRGRLASSGSHSGNTRNILLYPSEIQPPSPSSCLVFLCLTSIILCKDLASVIALLLSPSHLGYSSPAGTSGRKPGVWSRSSPGLAAAATGRCSSGWCLCVWGRRTCYLSTLKAWFISWRTSSICTVEMGREPAVDYHW